MAVRRGSHHSDLLVNWQEVTSIRLYYKLFQLALYFSVIYNIRATSEPCLAPPYSHDEFSSGIYNTIKC